MVCGEKSWAQRKDREMEKDQSMQKCATIFPSPHDETDNRNVILIVISKKRQAHQIIKSNKKKGKRIMYVNLNR